jgi:Na+/alanine symporter
LTDAYTGTWAYHSYSNRKNQFKGENMMNTSNPNRRKQVAASMALGVALGAALGAALGNIAAGLAVGILIGGVGAVFRTKRL